MQFDESEFFKQATLSIFKDLESEAALIDIRSFLSAYMPVDGVTLTSFNPATRERIAVASVRPSSWPKAVRSHPCPPLMQEWINDELEALPPVRIVNHLAEISERQRLLLSSIVPENTCYIRMTLSLGTNCLGNIFISAEGNNRFTEDHARLIRLLYEPFTMAMGNILRHLEIQEAKSKLEEENSFLKQEMEASTEAHIIGADSGLTYVMEQVRQVSPLDSSVLLMGETGVGKEVIANAIHKRSPRKDHPLIKVNCGAIPENLIDSELFGHEKGAFTGAISHKKGRFERAHRGTIFLDEIAELPMPAQVRLLRVIQSQEFDRVGSSKGTTVDVRIIAATHRDLSQMVQEGRFREDLLFRLNVFPINIPPLRQRLSDIQPLVAHFIEKKTKEMKIKRHFQLAPGAFEDMLSYKWPGNVRELENVVEREIIRSHSVDSEKFIYFGRETPGKKPFQNMGLEHGVIPLEQVMARHIKQALIQTGGRIEGASGAAALLAINPSTLRSKMRKLGITFGRKKHERIPQEISSILDQ